ncbi:MAG TPA: GAF domain-containing sensor histidine kinase [Rubrobacter sp.]|nr:GAF domain-containing sensor histidine kinase [Rubrobacter sp.]
MSLKVQRSARFADGIQATKPSSLSGGRLLFARVVWMVVVALALGLLCVSIPAQYGQLVAFASPGLDPATVRDNLKELGVSADLYATYMLFISTASAFVWIVVGAVIFWRRSEDRMALFASLCLITFGAFTLPDVFNVNNGPGVLSEQYPAVLVPVELLGFVGSVSMGLFLYFFPDGRFVPRWTGWLIALWAIHETIFYFFRDSSLNLDNSVPLLDFALIALFLGVGTGAQLYRYRCVSAPVQCQQTKWVVFGMVSAGLGIVALALPLSSSTTLAQFGSPWSFVLQTGIYVSMLLVPLSIGLAILRQRLWDIDILINRTLVFGALTASVVAIYALVVGTLGYLLQEARGNFLVTLVAAGFVAVLFAPLRDKLQRAVNRLMYGDRDDPYGVLSHLGRRLEATLEPGAVLPTVVDTVAVALKLPYTAIAMRREDGFEVAAAHGSPTGEETGVPLNYAGETVGQLLLSPRTPGEKFTSADKRLLEDLARQAEVAVQAVRLTSDLQRSRERLVGAREEERRRLRRDLHDGLGPTLATLSLGLDVSLKMLKDSPDEAEPLLRELKSQTQAAVADIRRLVYGLRPPALDDLGLVPAIREQASKHGKLADDPATFGRGAAGKNALAFSVEAPEKLPPLPAAVEVACYRIVQEAITNVVRHSEARTCRIRLSIDAAENELGLEIVDDGVGIPEDRHAGVGMSSMAERAAELGGTCKVEAGPEGGTSVLARFPLFAEDEE